MSTAKQKPASDLEREVFSIQCASGSATSMSVGVCDIFFIFFKSLALSCIGTFISCIHYFAKKHVSNKCKDSVEQAHSIYRR